MIDIVIPFIHSRWNDTEIVYALRSAEKHLSGVGRVFVVGDAPKLKNINHVPFENDSRREFKERNVYRKIMAAINQVSDDFLFMNDDHFLLADYEAATFPNYYAEWPVKTDMYKHTMDWTKDITPDAPFFDIHCPMLMNKQRFIERMKLVDWDKPAGYCLKTLYADGLSGENYPDLKIRLIERVNTIKAWIYGRKWFSICDHARGPEMLSVLNELYSLKSKYEMAN